MTTNSTSIYLGFASCVISTIFFGTGFVPLKKIELKDGIHCQWIMCCAMYVGGLIIGTFDGYSHFYVLSMVAGALFFIANGLSVWIISRTGIALAALFCSFPQLLTGWLCGRFGLFGIKVRIPHNEGLNITGLLLSLFRAIAASILAGLLYGFCFVPVIYMQDVWTDAPKSSLPYMFSFYCGAFAASTVFFVAYCIVMKDAAFVQPKTVLPSFLCGILRVISQTAFFLAIENLSETVTFPIVTRFPCVITTLWGIIVFKEIQGRRNFVIVGIAVVVTLIGGLCSGLSKIL